MLKNLTPAKNVASTRPITTSSMPLCCVPSCSSNYRSSGTARLFDVPNDPNRRTSWKNALGHEQPMLSKGSRICHRHFESRFIVKGGSYIGQDGIERHYKLRKWRLREDAVPIQSTSETLPTEKTAPDVPPERCFKVETTCRTCSIQIGDENEGTPLFNGSLSLKKFRPDIFRELEQFGLQIDVDDGLPQQICQKCLQSFSILIQFRKQCQRVQTDLLRYFKGRKNMRKSMPSDEEIITLDDNGEISEVLDAAAAADSIAEAAATSVSEVPASSIVATPTSLVVENAPKKARIECIDEDVGMEEPHNEMEQPQIEEEGDVENWICEYYIVSDDKKVGNAPQNSLGKTDTNAGMIGQQNKQENMTRTLLQFPSNKIPMEHTPTRYNQDSVSGKIIQKRCKLCQRLTNHCCTACIDCPRLCLDTCFEAFHQRLAKKTLAAGSFGAAK